MRWRQPCNAEIKYVPLYADDRSYKAKWEDREYLKSVSLLNHNKVFLSETLEALRELRDKADQSKTPMELKGCNAGIEIIKKLLSKAEMAKNRLIQLEEMDKYNASGNPSG